jgi:hypothetical protein
MVFRLARHTQQLGGTVDEHSYSMVTRALQTSEKNGKPLRGAYTGRTYLSRVNEAVDDVRAYLKSDGGRKRVAIEEGLYEHVTPATMKRSPIKRELRQRAEEAEAERRGGLVRHR